MMKRCSQCKEMKALEAFSKRKDGAQGRQGMCIVCRKIYMGSYNRRYNQRPEIKVLRNSQMHTRNALLEGRPYDEGITVDALRTEAHGICQICMRAVGNGERESIDHVIPISLGGSPTWDNVQYTHLSCNCSKRDWILVPKKAQHAE